MSNLASRLAASESASSTILAKDRTLSCDTRQTGLNNNALVIGPSGAGKTRNVLKPNLLQMNASYIVLDTKGTLLCSADDLRDFHQVGALLWIQLCP